MFLAPYDGAKLVLIFCWQESWPQEIAQLAVCELHAEEGESVFVLEFLALGVPFRENKHFGIRLGKDRTAKGGKPSA